MPKCAELPPPPTGCRPPIGGRGVRENREQNVKSTRTAACLPGQWVCVSGCKRDPGCGALMSVRCSQTWICAGLVFCHSWGPKSLASVPREIARPSWQPSHTTAPRCSQAVVVRANTPWENLYHADDSVAVPPCGACSPTGNVHAGRARCVGAHPCSGTTPGAGARIRAAHAHDSRALRRPRP